MIYRIPEYNGTETHTGTDWYVFQSNDTSDKSDSIFSVTNKPEYKNIVNITINIPVGNIYYLVAYLKLSDGTVIITDPMPMTHYDMDGKKIHPISYGVETPRINIVSNDFANDGDIVISTTKIRPTDNVLKKQVIVVTDETNTVLKYDEVEGYEYTIDRNIIPTDTHDIIVYVAHIDHTNTSSEFARQRIHLVDNDILLLNPKILPLYQYIPKFEGEYGAVTELVISDNGSIVFSSPNNKVPKNTLLFDKSYEMIVTFRVENNQFKTYTYRITTVSSKSVDYLEEYEYTGFENTDEYNLFMVDNSHIDITARNLMGFVDNEEYVVKYLNNASYTGKIHLPYEPLSNSETINLADNIVYTKYKTENGFAVIVVNLSSEYAVPAILSSIEITDALSNDCVMISGHDIVYLRENGAGEVELVNRDIDSGNDKIITVVPDEYITDDNPQTGYEGLYNNQYSMFLYDNLILIMNRNLGVFAYDRYTSSFKFIFNLEDEDKGKSYFGLRLHGNKMMYVNTNSNVYVYDFDVDEAIVTAIDPSSNVINILAYEVLFKTENGYLIYK